MVFCFWIWSSVRSLNAWHIVLHGVIRFVSHCVQCRNRVSFHALNVKRAMPV